MKSKEKLTREQIIEKARLTIKKIPTATRVEAWSFDYDKKIYAIISFFMPMVGNCIEVYPSNRKGIKTSDIPIVKISLCNDHMRGFELAMEKLLPLSED